MQIQRPHSSFYFNGPSDLHLCHEYKNSTCPNRSEIYQAAKNEGKGKGVYQRLKEYIFFNFLMVLPNAWVNKTLH